MTSCKSSDMRHIRRNIKKKVPEWKTELKTIEKKDINTTSSSLLCLCLIKTDLQIAPGQSSKLTNIFKLIQEVI